MEENIKAKEIVMVEVDKILPHPKNRNKHPEDQIQVLSKIISYQGFRDPVIISNRSGFLVSGHGRIEAAKRIGITSVPAMYQDFDDNEQEYAAVISLNSISLWSELDLSEINSDIPDLGPFDIELLGIKNFVVDMAELDEMTEKLKEDMNKKFILEVTFPNDLEMMDIHDDLVSRGYIVKVRDK